MKERAAAERISSAGGRLYVVGGWVRDRVRGAVPHDKDYVITGLSEADFCAVFPEAKKIGKAFPVYLVRMDGKPCEIAFARREKKTGAGYRGFSVDVDPSVTIEEDLFRRDTTMNSMAIALPEGDWIDPYGGRADIGAKRIRAVSEHFLEDPVRALRAARQAAQFGFRITEETYAYMKKCRAELALEPGERIFLEMQRALATDRPSIFFRALQRAELLEVTFPELFVLIGKTQPKEFHPEGDAWAHTMDVVDAVAGTTHDAVTRFCALVHDLGKGRTPPEMLPHHYGHERTGLAALRAWNERMVLPHGWLQAGLFVIQEHMRAPRIEKIGKMAALLLDIDKSAISLEGFCAVVRADHHGLPDYLESGAEYLAAMQSVRGEDAPERLRGKAIGDWIFAQQVAILRAIRAKNGKAGPVR